MYKYERSASCKESDNSKKYKSKPNFDDVLEFKHSLPKKMGIDKEVFQIGTDKRWNMQKTNPQ